MLLISTCCFFSCAFRVFYLCFCFLIYNSICFIFIYIFFNPAAKLQYSLWVYRTDWHNSLHRCENHKWHISKRIISSMQSTSCLTSLASWEPVFLTLLSPLFHPFTLSSRLPCSINHKLFSLAGLIHGSSNYLTLLSWFAVIFFCSGLIRILKFNYHMRLFNNLNLYCSY